MGRVIVVGAGVVGLTCAVRLLEAGHRVDVVTPLYRGIRAKHPAIRPADWRFDVPCFGLRTLDDADVGATPTLAEIAP